MENITRIWYDVSKQNVYPTCIYIYMFVFLDWYLDTYYWNPLITIVLIGFNYYPSFAVDFIPTHQKTPPTSSRCGYTAKIHRKEPALGKFFRSRYCLVNLMLGCPKKFLGHPSGISPFWTGNTSSIRVHFLIYRNVNHLLIGTAVPTTFIQKQNIFSKGPFRYIIWSCSGMNGNPPMSN